MTSRSVLDVSSPRSGRSSKEGGRFNRRTLAVAVVVLFVIVPFLIFNYQIGFIVGGSSNLPHKELHVKGHVHPGTRGALLRRKFQLPVAQVTGGGPADAELDDVEGVPVDDEPEKKQPGTRQPPAAGSRPPPHHEAVSPNPRASASGDPTHTGAPAAESRAAAVREAMQYAWKSYSDRCWGTDEFHPVSKSCSDWVGMGLTIVDALDTLHLMGLKEEFDRGVQWVTDQLNPRPARTVSFFETTIRVLGGLLSAYDYSGQKPLLDKARVLGDALLPAFSTPTGLPRGQVNLASGSALNAGWTGDSSLLAEVGTVQLEFTYLSAKTGDPQYAQKAQAVIDRLDALPKPAEGLYPLFVSVESGQFTPSKISLGAMGDSFYEYLLKMWLLTGKRLPQYRRMYQESARGIMRRLLHRSPEGLAYVADLEHSATRVEHKMDELACFTPGMLALGVISGAIENATEAAEQLQAAEDLAETCANMFMRTPTGLAGEYVTFRPNMATGDFTYHLRPETVESMFLLWRATHKQRYRDWAWAIFQAIEKQCKVDTGGYTGLSNVMAGTKQNKQESFLLAETFKYLYLLFREDEFFAIDGPNARIFNTEAHPLSIIDPPLGLGTRTAQSPAAAASPSPAPVQAPPQRDRQSPANANLKAAHRDRPSIQQLQQRLKQQRTRS